MTTLTDTQVVTASGGLVELGYVQRTSDYIVNSTTVAGAANVFASNLTIVSDGSPFLIEFNCGRAVTSSGGPYINIYLVDGSGNSIAMMNLLFPGGTQAAAHCQIRIQPPAGTYSYNVRTIYSGAGSASLAGGTGTGGNQSPILLRASKIVTATQWPAVTTGTIICTSTTRPASPFEGQTIYETDTDRELRWSGSAWIDAAGSNLVYSGSISASSFNVTDIFTSAYANYQLVFDYYGSVAMAPAMRLRNATESILGYYSAGTLVRYDNSTVVGVSNNNGDRWDARLGHTDTGSTSRCQTTIFLNGPALSVNTTMTGMFNDARTAGGAAPGSFYGYHNSAATYSGFAFYATSGSLTGTVRVYGLAN